MILKKRNWSAELYLYLNVQFTENAGETFAELISAGAVIQRMVVGYGGCFKGGTSDVCLNYQVHTLLHLHVDFCQR